MWDLERELFKKWLSKNKYLIFMTVGIYEAAILAIGIVNFPYIDDTARQLAGGTDFAKSYSRWGSEFASWLVQGSRHLTDMGLTTHILTGMILAFASIIAVYVLNDKKLAVLPLVVSTIIGLNPWFLQNVSFRFDSPYMALSILASFAPFLWWEKNKKTFFIMSIIGIFFMCNTYQASSGIYIVMVLALALKEIVSNEKMAKILQKVLLSAIAYMIAMFVYLFETKFNPELANRGGNVVVARLVDMPKTILDNSQMYLNKILEQSAHIWIYLFVILIALFILTNVLSSEANFFKTLFFVIAYLILAAILSYGIFLIFPEKLALASPRYAYGFSVFVALTFILLLRKMPLFSFNLVTKLLVSLFCYYLLSFPFIYAASLHYQKESFERQSLILATDLKNVITPDTTGIYSNTLFKESPILLNTERNYPIIDNLVPHNQEIYWPNQLLFITYTGIQFNIQAFAVDKFEKKAEELKVSDYYYDIYKKDTNIYVIMK